jgi:GntR family transcriptional regulator
VAFLNRPLYLQVRDVLAERIVSGDLLPGSAIPSETDLAREIGVSTGTVRKALQLMEADRLIVRKQGRGTFVSNPSSDDIAARFTRFHDPSGGRIRAGIAAAAIARGRASQLEQARLHLSGDDDVFRIRRVHYHNSAPFLVEDAAMPAELFPGLDEGGRVPENIGVLAQAYRIPLGPARERVSIAAPPAAIAAALRMAPDVAAVVLDRVVAALDKGRPVEWRVAYGHLPGGYYLAEVG